jgi:hypothetical protein
VEVIVVEAIATSWELRVGSEGASAAAGGEGKGGDKMMRQWIGCHCDKTGQLDTNGVSGGQKTKLANCNCILRFVIKGTKRTRETTR